MSNPNRFVSRVYIKKGGSDVDRPVMQKLTELVVDQHSHMPDMFVLQFRDTGLELLDNGPFNLTDEIEIEAANADGERVVLIKGEITALEPHFGEGMVSASIGRPKPRHILMRKTAIWQTGSPRQPAYKPRSIPPAQFTIISSSTTNLTWNS